MKTGVWKTYIHNYKLDNSSILRIFRDISDKISCNLMKCDILILCNETYPYLKDVHTSVNQYFLSGHSIIVQNHAWVKDPFKVQDGLMDFNVTMNEKLIDSVSDSTLQLTFKNLPLVGLWCRIEKHPQLSEKCSSVSDYLSLQLYFLHTFRPK